MNNSEENPTHKKNTEHETSVQTDSPADSPISTADNVEIQHRFNELRSELLDNRAKWIDRWFAVISIIVVLVGYIGFTRFQEIETEAKGYVEEIKKNYDISVGYLDSIKVVNAEVVANNPEKAKQVATDVGENPRASLIDKAIAQAVFLQQQGKRDEAIEKWRSVAHITEGIDNDLAAGAWFSVGYLLEKSKVSAPEDIILAYDRAISLKPDYADAYQNRGVAKADLGQRDMAIVDYDKAIQLQPDYALAYTNRGIVKGKLGRYEDAIVDLDKAIRLKPDYAAYNARGAAKGALGHYEDAIVDLDKAIQLKPDADAYQNRGNAKDALGQFDAAIADYDKAIRLKSNAGLYYSRGATKDKLKLIDEARQDFEKARNLARTTGNNHLADLAEQGLRGLGSQE